MWSSHINNDSNAATDLSRSKVQDGDKVSIYPYLQLHMWLAALPTKWKCKWNLVATSESPTYYILLENLDTGRWTVHSSPQIFLQRLEGGGGHTSSWSVVIPKTAAVKRKLRRRRSYAESIADCREHEGVYLSQTVSAPQPHLKRGLTFKFSTVK